MHVKRVESGGPVLDPPQMTHQTADPVHPRFRRVNVWDAHMLWVWANDPLTMEMSHREFIPFDKHLEWFRDHAISNTFWIAVDSDDVPVGYLRLEKGWLSYGVSPPERGRGIGTAIVSSAVPGVRAKAYPENKASLAIFRKLEWHEIKHDKYVEFRR